jgi:hypothetical protein
LPGSIYLITQPGDTLLPNSHFNESFDYAYTRLGIYYENGKIIVEDVIKDSPAIRHTLR